MPVKDGVRYDVRDGIGRVTLERPKARNAMDEAMLRRLRELLEEIADDDGVRGVIVTGAGETFCAGADIGRLHACTPLEAREFARLAVDVNHRL